MSGYCRWCNRLILGNGLISEISIFGKVVKRGGPFCGQRCSNEWIDRNKAPYEQQEAPAQPQPERPRVDMHPGGRNCSTCVSFVGCWGKSNGGDKTHKDRLTFYLSEHASSTDMQGNIADGFASCAYRYDPGWKDKANRDAKEAAAEAAETAAKAATAAAAAGAAAAAEAARRAKRKAAKKAAAEAAAEAAKPVFCGDCGEQNRGDDIFCSGCGLTLKMKCPGCGAEVTGDKKFCQKCGADVSRVTGNPGGASGTAGPKKIETVFCGECGEKNTSDESFCGECGARLD